MDCINRKHGYDLAKGMAYIVKSRLAEFHYLEDNNTRGYSAPTHLTGMAFSRLEAIGPQTYLSFVEDARKDGTLIWELNKISFCSPPKPKKCLQKGLIVR